MVDFKKLLQRKTTTVVSVDFETRATVDLLKTGVYPYARDRNTGIWCMAYAVDDEEDVGIWYLGQRFPERLARLMTDPNVTIEWRAWNANFERIIWKEVATKRYGWPAVPDDAWVDTAAEAAAMALPRSLEQCAAVTKVPFQKDMEGNKVMRRMMRPARWDPETMREPEWVDDGAALAILGNYCKQDVRAERALKGVLHRLTPRELRAYHLDQRINDRGIGIDRAMILAAMEVAKEGTDRAEVVLDTLTGGSVTKVGQTAKIREWLDYQGVSTPSIDKAHTRDLLAGDLPNDVREVLVTRGAAGRTSTTKLKAMLQCACVEDDRMRGLLLYHGAGTGRWTAKLAQPHNFPKGDVANIESYLPDLLAKAYDTIALFENPVAVVSSALRLMIVARAGHDFITSDYSAIEARVLNWISGNTEVTESFRKYDEAMAAVKRAKTPEEKAAAEAIAWQHDPYVRMAMAAYKLPASAIKKFPHRHTGKFCVLGMGYQMGAKTAVKQGKDQYQIELTEEQAQDLVTAYRTANPQNPVLWKESNNAAKQAVREPGSVVVFGPLRNLKFTKRGSYLYLILPSGRALVYADPRLEKVKTPWIKKEEEESGMLSDPNEWPEAVVVWGVESQKKQWIKYALYGGIIVENIVQALSRDIMLEGMFKLEELQYPVVLTVHDEIVTEVAEGFGSVEEMERTMRETPQWAAGCPINAEGWRGKRYRK